MGEVAKPDVSETGCECPLPGFCHKLGRYMHECRWNECRTLQPFHDLFVKEADEGKFDHWSYAIPPVPLARLRTQGRPDAPQRNKAIVSITNVRKVKNAGRAALDFMSTPKRAPLEQVGQRREICDACEFRSGNVCTGCGCNLAAKRRMAAFHCPFGMWPGDDEYYQITTPIRHWSVGMTTCPREKPTLEQSVASVRAAGWKNIEIFNDDQRHLGPWNNFRQSLANMIAAEPDAHAYMLLQDDIQVSLNARAYLESVLWPDTNKLGVVSIYCYGGHKGTPHTGPWFSVPAEETTWGALALIFTPVSARAFVRQTVSRTRRAMQLDRKVGTWAKFNGWDYVRHVPSLIEHTGVTSAIRKSSDMNPNRRAFKFAADVAELCR